MTTLRFIKPIGSWLEQALAFHRAGPLDDAARLYQQVLEQDPRVFDAVHMMGVLRLQTSDHGAARYWLSRALALHENDPNLLRNLGRLELDAGQAVAAEHYFERALAIMPADSVALRGRAQALALQDRDDDALEAYDAALTAEPGSVAARLGKANMLGRAGDFAAVIALCYDVPADDPAFAEAQVICGRAYYHLGSYDEAEASLAPLFEAGVRLPTLVATLLSTRQQACDWRGLDVLREAVSIARDAAYGNMNLPMSALDADMAEQLRWARAAGAKYQTAVSVTRRPHRKDRRRIGYLSADLRDHAVARVTAELFELHRRDRFEIFAYSLCQPTESALHQRLRTGFDQFVDVAGLTDPAIATMIANDEIDILVDMMGYTKGGRPGVLARRPAPLQLSWLGYAATMGVDWIDYILADRTLIHPQDTIHYTEQIVWLPETYQPNDRKRAIDPTPDRASQGLPPDGFVFACMNHTFKIHPRMFSVWMRLLAAKSGSVLWLVDDTPTTSNNLRRGAARHGIDPDRLVFAQRVPLDVHLGRLKLADLFLDTLPTTRTPPGQTHSGPGCRC